MRNLLATAGLLLLAGAALAHPLAPSLLEVIERAPGDVLVRWKTPAKRVPGSRLAPVLPPECDAVGDPVVRGDPAGVVTEWTLSCPGPVAGRTLAIEDIASSKAAVLLRIELADGRRLLHVLGPDDPAFVIPARQSRAAVARSYGWLGIEHILTGPDHLLFVLGLVLLVGGGRPLLWTVTAFTAGHSVTLSLAVLGYVNFPVGPIEVLIALSIFVLATELARRSPTPSLLSRKPWLMAFAFGLLHGFGFAGALAEIGLPSVDIPLALLSFNVGIEIGQLAFVLSAVLVGALLTPLARRRPRLARLVPTYVIGSLAAYWVFERLAAL
jgi:hydrogenase/urease accessory protein HupE